MRGAQSLALATLPYYHAGLGPYGGMETSSRIAFS